MLLFMHSEEIAILMPPESIKEVQTWGMKILGIVALLI